MEDAVWNIVLLEDDEDDYTITRNMLESVRPGKIQLTWFTTPDVALEYVRHNPVDAILVDLALGKDNGFEFIAQAQDVGCKAPVIVISGFSDHQIDLEAMQAGAVDFLVKQEVTGSSLERSIRYAIHRQKT